MVVFFLITWLLGDLAIKVNFCSVIVYPNDLDKTLLIFISG